MIAKALATTVWSVTLLGIAGARPSPAGQVLEVDGVAVVVAAPGTGWADAAPSGRIGVVDGCLALDDDVVIWPPGTVVTSAEPLRILVPHFGTVRVGEVLAGGGGTSRYDAADVVPPGSCAAQRFPIIFWPDERVDR